MRNWYLLVRELVSVWPGPRETDDTSMAFMEGGGPPPDGALAPANRRRMFWLGLVESTPLFGMSLIGLGLDTNVSLGTWIVLGGAISVGCCWLLRHRTPPTVVHAAERTHRLHTDIE